MVVRLCGARLQLLLFSFVFFVSLVSLVSLVVHSPAADWPAWRGPLGTGVTPEKNLPVKWSATENVRWKVPLHGAGVSVPVVSSDRVFLTGSDGRLSDQLHIWCHDRADGKELWHVRLFGSAQPEGQFAPGGMAVPTPATDGKHLYVLFGTGDLVCLDFAGKPVWIRSLAEEYGPFRNRWGMGASPLLVNGLVVVLVDHFGQSYLLAVDARTGVNRWKTPREATVNWTSPVAAVVQGKTQIITAGTHRLHGYDAETGAELWTVRGLQEQCIPTPVVMNNLVYAVSGYKGDNLAIRLDGARGDLTKTHIVWKRSRGTPNIPTGVAYNGLYFMVEDNTGLGTCLDALTGEVHWTERIGGSYHASLVAGDGKVYFTNMAGTVTVVEASPKFHVLAKNNLDERIIATPAFSNGQIFIRGEKHLFCIGERGR
jgi:outer membrane protein assembly factor BamB